MGTRTIHDSVPEYQRIQRQFARYIRDPEGTDIPAGTEKRRMDIYRRLFFNNIAAFCSRSFKSFRPFVTDAEWQTLVRSFMREHACTSPYFKDIPLAFVDFVTRNDEIREKFPFIHEMCHLDALKMQLRLAPDARECLRLDITKQSTALWLSSTVHLLSYEWPVHKLTPSSWNGVKTGDPTWLIAFRDRMDQVQVLVTNAHTYRMLETLKEPIALQTLSAQLDYEFKVARRELQEKLIPTIQALQKRGIILTVKRN